MNYRIEVGNEYVQSRLLTVNELDEALSSLSDWFEGRIRISSIEAYDE